MRVLVTGAAGRLGSRVADVLRGQGHEAITADVPEFDIANFPSTRAWITAAQPDFVIHPAAWTDVDGCAREPDKAITINGLGAGNVAAVAAELGVPILYVSSNEVFDGTAARPYLEYDRTQPINPYGYSKWVGEQAVMAANPRHMIARTSWLFAHGGKNFIQSILNAAGAGKPLRVVVNEIACPTYNDDLAAALVKLMESGRPGIYHMVNEGYCSRYDFARYVLDRTGHTETPIERISTHAWARPSTPPEFSPLQNLAGKMIGVELRSWQGAVDAFLEKEGLRTED